MTRTTPCRRTILQFRQIFFTDASTFISLSHYAVSSRLDGAPPESPAYLIPVT
jgi:hypothetical protein